MLSTIFFTVMEMSITAIPVIVVVMIVRLLLKQLPKSFSYVLWALVAFRLIVPVSISSEISIFNLSARISNLNNRIETVNTKKNLEKSDDADIQIVVPDIQGEVKAHEEQVFTEEGEILKGFETVTGTDHNSTYTYIVDENNIIIQTATIIWIAGIMILVSYSVIVYLRLKRRIRYSIRLSDTVCECDCIRSPFVLGIVHPKIYIPFRLDEKERQCILLHEQVHIRRKDHLIKGFAFMMTVMYWFQPLIWISFHLMCSDMEMSCDENVISALGNEMKKDYSRSLLAFASNKRQQFTSPLAFGEENTMKRVKNILQYKKPVRWKMIAGVLTIALTMAACATDAKDNENVNEIVNENEKTEKAEIMPATVENMTQQSEEVIIDIDHQPAQWAPNSMYDLELFTLDFADQDKIIFHISSGLFEYDLSNEKITRSLDLKALQCQEVQTGGVCRIEIYEDSSDRRKAVIRPYPYLDRDSYIYDFETDQLISYNQETLKEDTLFSGLVSKYDLQDANDLNKWQISEYVLPLEDNIYGVLRADDARLSTMCYEAEGVSWQLFDSKQATLPELLKQDDSFYQSFALYSGKNIKQCILEYQSFYNAHDYAGICALSTDLKYSDELQREWLTHTDRLEGGVELSHTSDEKEYVIRYTRFLDEQANKEPVDITFVWTEEQGWQAKELP